MLNVGNVSVGSSPRVWGIRFSQPANGTTVRFIPTCVGNTICVERKYAGPFGSSPRVWGILLQAASSAFPSTVHPHVCGEYCACIPGAHTLHRFIPTCVGNTTPNEKIFYALTGSSPRVWGILKGYTDIWEDYCGSSPRVWGIRLQARRCFCLPRFIPTCVGNTPPSARSICWSSVHPHVCGEYYPLIPCPHS